jgi:putative DNA primase/helicase
MPAQPQPSNEEARRRLIEMPGMEVEHPANTDFVATTRIACNAIHPVALRKILPFAGVGSLGCNVVHLRAEDPPMNDDPFVDHAPAKPEDTAKPTIRVVGGSLAENATEAESALIAAGIPLYRRRADWVRPVVEITDASDDRKTHVAQLVPIDPIYLRDLLARHANWEKYVRREKQWVGINPPSDVAATILKRFGEWRLLPVSAIINTPTLRPDGTILSAPGYDAQTQFILVNPPPMIEKLATRANAETALKMLDALLDEFPVADQPDEQHPEKSASRSVALSAIITPVVRAAFPFAPMHVMDAPVAGSGKSYLLDIVAAIATGDLMPVISAGPDEEEMEKRLGSALLVAQPLISLDNVNGPLGGDFLCQVVERPIVNVRILGKSKIVPVEPRGTTLYATGNNIQITGDMPRRSIRCTLDPRVEQPELRQFKSNPVETVLGARGDYIAACFCIVRAFRQDENAKRVPRLASFEGWSDTVRSALVWLGRADPCDTVKAIRNDDPQRTTLAAVLEAWATEIGVGQNYACTGAEIVDKVNAHDGEYVGTNYTYPALRAAIMATAFRGKLDARGLGYWLRPRKAQIIDGRYLASGTIGHNAAWYVEEATAPGSTGEHPDEEGQ